MGTYEDHDEIIIGGQSCYLCLVINHRRSVYFHNSNFLLLSKHQKKAVLNFLAQPTQLAGNIRLNFYAVSGDRAAPTAAAEPVFDSKRRQPSKLNLCDYHIGNDSNSEPEFCGSYSEVAFFHWFHGTARILHTETSKICMRLLSFQ